MEKKNETNVFGHKKEQTRSKYQAGKTAASAVAGAAVGMAVSAFATDDPEPVVPESTPEPTPVSPAESDTTSPVNPEPAPEPVHNRNTAEHGQKESDTDHLPEPEPEPEPVMPVVEIDPNDNELANVIEDVTTIEVVYDINGNPMLAATAHNPVDGEFYLLDVDMDGDFDVVLNSAGDPVADLTGENDRLITVTDLDPKITDEYIARNDMDDIIAQNDMIGEQIQNDIIINDGGSV